MGTTQYWQIDLERRQDRGVVAWNRWRLDADDHGWVLNGRPQFVTNDEAVVLMHYTGLVEQTSAFSGAAAADQPTDWNHQYMRLAVSFDTAAPRYRWLLRESIFVPAGRLLGIGCIEYDLRRVT